MPLPWIGNDPNTVPTMTNPNPSQILRMAVALAAMVGPLASIACEPDQPQMDPVAHGAEIRAWQARRVEGLKNPTGWLSVAPLSAYLL